MSENSSSIITSKLNKTGLLTNNSRFQVNKDGSGDVLPSPRLTEESGEGVIVASHGLVAGHLTVWLYPML